MQFFEHNKISGIALKNNAFFDMLQKKGNYMEQSLLRIQTDLKYKKKEMDKNNQYNIQQFTIELKPILSLYQIIVNEIKVDLQMADLSNVGNSFYKIYVHLINIISMLIKHDMQNNKFRISNILSQQIKIFDKIQEQNIHQESINQFKVIEKIKYKVQQQQIMSQARQKKQVQDLWNQINNNMKNKVSLCMESNSANFKNILFECYQLTKFNSNKINKFIQKLQYNIKNDEQNFDVNQLLKLSEYNSKKNIHLVQKLKKIFEEFKITTLKAKSHKEVQTQDHNYLSLEKPQKLKKNKQIHDKQNILEKNVALKQLYETTNKQLIEMKVTNKNLMENIIQLSEKNVQMSRKKNVQMSRKIKKRINSQIPFKTQQYSLHNSIQSQPNQTEQQKQHHNNRQSLFSKKLSKHPNNKGRTINKNNTMIILQKKSNKKFNIISKWKQNKQNTSSKSISKKNIEKQKYTLQSYNDENQSEIKQQLKDQIKFQQEQLSSQKFSRNFIKKRNSIICRKSRRSSMFAQLQTNQKHQQQIISNKTHKLKGSQHTVNYSTKSISKNIPNKKLRITNRILNIQIRQPKKHKNFRYLQTQACQRFKNISKHKKNIDINKKPREKDDCFDFEVFKINKGIDKENIRYNSLHQLLVQSKKLY